MFKQTENYYKKQMLGFGSGSIYSYGCYLVSLVNGLVDFGHDFSPRTFNEFLREKKLWFGKFGNYINVDRLSSVLPEIFTSYKRIDNWPGFDKVNWYLDRDYIVLGKVDARGIGGSGSHFVRIFDTAKNNTIIQDPWFGTTEPVTNKYSKYSNILSLRVFKIKQKDIMPDNTNDAARKSRDHYWNVLKKIAKFVNFKLEKEDDVDKLPDTIDTVFILQAEQLKECENKPIVSVPEPNAKWELNGKTEQFEKDGKTITLNYAVKHVK